MSRWIKLARKLTKVRPKVALEFLESCVNRVLPKSEEIPDINYPNRSITIEHGSKDLIISLAKYRAILDIDRLLSLSSINDVQWCLQVQLSNNYGNLPQEDTATISALMVQKLQEEEYIKDITLPM
jgi:hypothetical protein